MAPEKVITISGLVKSSSSIDEAHLADVENTAKILPIIARL
jgi:hypothetical protein